MTLEREIRLFGFNLWFAEQLIKDIPTNVFAHQPSDGMNPPAWILGHLTVVTDSALQLLGQSPAVQPRWHSYFDPGSHNQSEETYPLKDELWSGFFAAHQRVTTAAKNVSLDRLASPNPAPYPLMSRNFPTVGDQVAHLMTVHESLHLGQLSAWRRAMGMPGVMNLAD